MKLDSNQIRYFHRFGEQRANVLEMRKDALSVGVTFAAENLVAITGKLIEKIFLLGFGFLNEGGEGCFEGIEFPWMNFEVGMQTDEVRQRFHPQNLGLIGTGVDDLIGGAD